MIKNLNKFLVIANQQVVSCAVVKVFNEKFKIGELNLNTLNLLIQTLKIIEHSEIQAYIWSKIICLPIDE